MTSDMRPGEILFAESRIVINPGRSVIEIEVMNTGDRPVQVGSHFHFAETNSALRFDRVGARGMHLAIPAGTSVRFEPGVGRSVSLTPFAGRRIVAGFTGAVGGPLDE